MYSYADFILMYPLNIKLIKKQQIPFLLEPYYKVKYPYLNEDYSRNIEILYEFNKTTGE